MGASTRRTALQCFPFLVTGLLALVAPSSALGQETPTVSDERLVTYAETFVEIGRLRDAMQAELARVANKTNQAQERLREELRLQIKEAIEEKGLTVEEYEQITHLISFDQERREKFDELVADAASASGAMLD